MVYVNKNPLPLFRRLNRRTYRRKQTKIPCQQRKLIQGILRKSVTDFHLRLICEKKVSLKLSTRTILRLDYIFAYWRKNRLHHLPLQADGF